MTSQKTDTLTWKADVHRCPAGSVICSVMHFEFQGPSEYLEDIVTQIVAP
jgi:hypothetical protein